MRNEIIIGIVLLILFSGGLWFVLSRDDSAQTMTTPGGDFPGYKEIENPSGFLNTDGEEITIGQYIGNKVILLDFVTYSCINCIRTFPYLNDWYKKYEDDGLIIVGIHTPEFAFEHDIDNVRKALAKEGIEFPVVLDNDYATWRAYGNKFWPRKYLINKDGKIVYDHIGEGAYEETEEKIVELLNDLNKTTVKKEAGDVDSGEETDFSKVKSRETYFGSSRIEFINNLPNTQCLSSSCEYTAPKDIPFGSFSLDGTWKIGAESAVLESETGSIFLRFSANKVHLVAGGGGTAQLYLDGKLVTSEIAGEDVMDGVVNFDNEDFYNLIDLQGDAGEHLLEIRLEGAGSEAFAFTFG